MVCAHHMCVHNAVAQLLRRQACVRMLVTACNWRWLHMRHPQHTGEKWEGCTPCRSPPGLQRCAPPPATCVACLGSPPAMRPAPLSDTGPKLLDSALSTYSAAQHEQQLETGLHSLLVLPAGGPSFFPFSFVSHPAGGVQPAHRLCCQPARPHAGSPAAAPARQPTPSVMQGTTLVNIFLECCC